MKYYKFIAEFENEKVTLDNVKIDRLPEKNEEGKWLPIVTTIHIPDGTEDSPELANLWKVLASFYKYGNEVFEQMIVEEPKNVMESMLLGKGSLTNAEDDWRLSGLWPHSVNFGDLCYSTTSEMDIEITWRFFNATYYPFISGFKTPERDKF